MEIAADRQYEEVSIWALVMRVQTPLEHMISQFKKKTIILI